MSRLSGGASQSIRFRPHSPGAPRVACRLSALQRVDLLAEAVDPGRERAKLLARWYVQAVKPFLDDRADGFGHVLRDGLGAARRLGARLLNAVLDVAADLSGVLAKHLAEVPSRLHHILDERARILRERLAGLLEIVDRKSVV